MAAGKKKAFEVDNDPVFEGRTEVVERTPLDRWPTRTIAARMLGVSIVTIDRMQALGEVPCERDPKGVWRFDPDALHEIASAKNQTDPLGAAAVIEASHGLVSQAQEHTEALVKHVTGPGLSILELQNTLLKTAYDENQKLREKNFAMLEAHERMQSQQHDRDLQAKLVEHDQLRKDQAWEMLLKIAPGMLHKLAANFGQGQQVSKVVDALVEIPDEFIDVFAKMDILKPDQLEAIKTLRKAHPGRAKTVADVEAAHAAKETETAPEPAPEASVA